MRVGALTMTGDMDPPDIRIDRKAVVNSTGKIVGALPIVTEKTKLVTEKTKPVTEVEITDPGDIPELPTIGMDLRARAKMQLVLARLMHSTMLTATHRTVWIVVRISITPGPRTATETAIRRIETETTTTATRIVTEVAIHKIAKTTLRAVLTTTAHRAEAMVLWAENGKILRIHTAHRAVTTTRTAPSA
jgi:hypothetical protein